MNKRSHGEGSLSRRLNGSWLAQVSVEKKRISKTFRLRKDAQEWLSTTNKQVRQGLTFSSSKTTVSEVLATWLEMKKANSRPATEEQYRRTARRCILPYLGEMKMQDLNAARIQALYGQLEKIGTGKRTAEVVQTVLHGFLKYALRHGLVAQNWSELVEVPKPEHRQMSVWDESQVSQFLLTVPEDPFYRLVFATGMRRGELIGLQWKDLDFQTGMLHVRRQVYTPEGGGFIFQPPKTDRGVRNIRLGKGLMEALRYHYSNTIPQMKAIAGDRWQEYDLMFPSSKGTPRCGYEVSRAFHNLVKQSGLPQIRFHDIRHTAASIMLLHGEPAVRVAGILGDTLAILLSTYAHYIPDDQERAANLMDEITTITAIELPDCNDLQPIESKHEVLRAAN